MKTRRGSLWGGGLENMITQYKPGDIVKPVAVRDLGFLGTVREVDARINKVLVAWGGGSIKQHDPDEIMLMPMDLAARERMTMASVGRRGSLVTAKKASVKSRRGCDCQDCMDIAMPPEQTDFVSPSMEDLMNQQVGYEMYSAYLYFMMAAWFQSKGLVGFQSWVAKQGNDEIGHAMKVYKYLVDTGSSVELPAIDAPVLNPDMTVLEACGLILEHEKTVTQDWKAIGALAKQEDNAATCKLVQEFMVEQIEEEDGAYTLYQKVQMADTGSGILMVDNDLKDRGPNKV